MKFLEPMIVAFSMYSKIPMPRIEWNKENMKYTMCFFPLIGVVTEYSFIWQECFLMEIFFRK